MRRIKDKAKSAKEFAKEKHKNQFRKDCKTPYFKHLKQVVKRLEKLGITDKEILCAGWLHDTIEDTSTDYDDIYKRWGTRVADIVSSVTKETRLNEKERESKYVQQLKRASWEAKVIKLADIVANISDLENTDYDETKIKNQIKTKLGYLDIIKPEIISNKEKLPGLPLIEKQINNVVESYNLKKIILH